MKKATKSRNLIEDSDEDKGETNSTRKKRKVVDKAQSPYVPDSSQSQIVRSDHDELQEITPNITQKRSYAEVLRSGSARSSLSEGSEGK